MKNVEAEDQNNAQNSEEVVHETEEAHEKDSSRCNGFPETTMAADVSVNG